MAVPTVFLGILDERNLYARELTQDFIANRPWWGARSPVQRGTVNPRQHEERKSYQVRECEAGSMVFWSPGKSPASNRLKYILFVLEDVYDYVL